MMLEGKTAIITGAGKGIGRATALLFTQHGANIVAFERDEADLDQLVGEIEALGGKAACVAGDVTNRQDVKLMTLAAMENFGGVDFLINNAGITRDGLVARGRAESKWMGDEMWDAVIDVNLKGTFLCSQIVGVEMMAQRHGRIVNTSSVASLGNIGQANYSASKAGVIGLTRTLALEWARYNINVNCVAPGAIRTRLTEVLPDAIKDQIGERIPMKRAGEPEEIAAAHLFFCSDLANYITGQTLFVDGGMSVGI